MHDARKLHDGSEDNSDFAIVVCRADLVADFGSGIFVAQVYRYLNVLLAEISPSDDWQHHIEIGALVIEDLRRIASSELFELCGRYVGGVCKYQNFVFVSSD